MSVARPGARACGPASVLIAQLARGTRRRIEHAVAPTGLRPRELLTLQHLRDRGPAAQQTLAELIGVDATNLVGVLNGMEDAGLIERRRDRADRRRAIVALSDKGAQLLVDLDAALERVDAEVLAPLSRRERETLTALLSKAAEHLATTCWHAREKDC